MKTNPTAGLLKIGELAKATNVNVSTLKFYVKEGLIQPVRKSSQNMAYYHKDCIEKIQLIKHLQRVKYYPLSVIKNLLESTTFNPAEIDLLDAVHKSGYKNENRLITVLETVKLTRLTSHQIAVLAKEELVTPLKEGRKLKFSATDVKVMSLVRRRIEVGIPFEESVKSFVIYTKALKEATQADVDLFISGVLMVTHPSAEEGSRMIRTSDETLDEFINIKREVFNHEFGSNRINDYIEFESTLSSMLSGLEKAFASIGKHAEAAKCRPRPVSGTEATGILSETLNKYIAHVSSGSLAKSILLCGERKRYFTLLTPNSSDGASSLLLYCLKLYWLSLAPPLFGCSEEAKKTAAGFESFAYECIGEQSVQFTKVVRETLVHLGGSNLAFV